MKQSQEKTKIISLFVLILIFGFHLTGFSNSPGLVGAESSYHFVDHLRKAEVWGIDSRGYQKRGLWKRDRFLFSGVGVDSEVKKTLRTAKSGNEQAVIRFHTLQSVRRILEFESVPTGSSLVVHHGILSSQEKEGVAYVNFRISLGQNLLKEIRIENKEQWQKTVIPLGIYSFLNRKGVFRFEVFSDSKEPIHFYFDAEIQP